MKHQADHTLPSAVGQAEPSPDRREFLRIAGTSAAAAGMLATAGGTAFAAAPMGAALPSGADNFYTSN